MLKMEARVEIKYIFIKGFSRIEVKVEIDATLNEDTSSFTTVKMNLNMVVWALKILSKQKEELSEKFAK